jgi:hypothetical protein
MVIENRLFGVHVCISLVGGFSGLIWDNLKKHALYTFTESNANHCNQTPLSTVL